jgi:hypothetical protein
VHQKNLSSQFQHELAKELTYKIFRLIWSGLKTALLSDASSFDFAWLHIPEAFEGTNESTEIDGRTPNQTDVDNFIRSVFQFCTEEVAHGQG